MLPPDHPYKRFADNADALFEYLELVQADLASPDEKIREAADKAMEAFVKLADAIRAFDVGSPRVA